MQLETHQPALLDLAACGALVASGAVARLSTPAGRVDAFLLRGVRFFKADAVPIVKPLDRADRYPSPAPPTARGSLRG
jgi:hypothetical protein